MYLEPSYGGGGFGLGAFGQWSSLILNGGGDSSDPCADTFFASQHPEQCNLIGASEPAPIPEPVPETQTTILTPTTDPTVLTFGTFAEPEAGPEADLVTSGGSGGGFELVIPGDDEPTDPLSMAAGDVFVDVTAPASEGRGFGLVEAAVAAGLAVLIGRAWQDRG